MFAREIYLNSLRYVEVINKVLYLGVEKTAGAGDANGKKRVFLLL